MSKERAKLPSETPSKEASIASKWLIPQWSETPLNRITRKAVKKWVATELKERPGMSPAYAHKIFSVFRISMNKAVDEESLDASPCFKIELPELRKKAKSYVSVENAAAMRPHFPEKASFYADMIEFGLEVGMRPSELAGLRAHRIYRKRRKVLVTDVCTTRRKVVRSHRRDGDIHHVPLSAAALRIVDRRLDGRDADAGCGVDHLDGTDCKHPLVFVNTLGRPVNANMLSAQMRAAAENAEIGSKSGYAIRRGFATRTSRAARTRSPCSE
ncbi:tyrosine-type recombinase/integrase [Amycolatopsis sp. VS8301801F10]|uniref:tyrosine-type recombinase/integrase n=1 Tax=Amycolatopsis sp. VS8301801F10 TaxID=2652442 RepID=UPI0038FD285E